MKKQKIAICDQDVEYTRQLVNYIAAKEKDSFEVTGFSDESLYRKNDENFDLLLYEETFFQNKEEAGRAKKAICLSNGEISTEQENMRVLFKYQPADRYCGKYMPGLEKWQGAWIQRVSGEVRSRYLPCILPGIIGFGHHLH